MKNSFCVKCKLFVNCETNSCLPNLCTNPNAKLLIVGAFPSAEEDRNKSIFSSSQAKVFLNQLENLGVQYYVTNIVRCTPYKLTEKETSPGEMVIVKTPSKPTLMNQKNCLPQFYKLVDEIKPKVIITIGSFATNTLLDLGLSIDKSRGHAYYHPEFNAFVVPVYDFDILKEDTIHVKHLQEDLRRAKTLVETRGFRPSVSHPRSLKDPVEIDSYLRSCLLAEKLSFDLETTGLNPRLDRITDISFCTTVGKGIHVKWKDMLPHLPLLQELLLKENILHIGQNLKFDRTFLLHNGIKTHKKYFDTMLGYHTLTMMHEGSGGGLYKLERLSWLFTHQGNYKSILEQWGGIGNYQEAEKDEDDNIIPSTKPEKKKPGKVAKVKEVRTPKPVARLSIYQSVEMFNRESYEEELEELEEGDTYEATDINYACREEYDYQIGNPLIVSLMNRVSVRTPSMYKDGEKRTEKEKKPKVSKDYIIDPEEDAILHTYEHMVSKRRLAQLEVLQLTPLEYYSAMDADVTLQVAEALMPLIDKDYKQLYYDLIIPLNRAITIMESHGTLLDIDYAKTQVSINEEKMLEYSKKIYELLGKEVNLSSKDDLRAVIYGDLKIKPDQKYMTKGGKGGQNKQPSVDQFAVEHFSKKYPKHTEFFDALTAYTNLEKENSTSFNGFLRLIDPVTGRIHGGFLQTTTATGRLSCIAEGTKISCVGEDKNIEHMQVGDIVYCYDDSGKLRISKVTNVIDNGIQECVKVKWQSSGNGKTGELICTPDHKIFTTHKGWVEAKDLKRYDKMYHLKKAYNISINYAVTEVEQVIKQQVHDLEVEDYHNFLANEICVHNCTKPNLQNIPQADHVRNMIIPSPGCKLVGADLSQAELRILAMVSGDSAMKAGFASGFDFHVYTASSMFNIPLLEFDATNNPKHKSLRAAAKSINFGIAYGRGAKSIAEQVGCTQPEADAFMNKFFAAYPKVKQWIGDTIVTARRVGYVETVHGRRRYLPYINSSDATKRNHAENQAINTPVQGTASDCACYGLIRITDFAIDNGYKARPCMIIHDEIQMDTPEEEVELFAKQLPFAMTDSIPLITVPLVASVSILDKWSK